MPSDPTGRHPSGVLIRPAPDFYDDQIGVCGFEFVEISPPVGLHYHRFALYNNASTGAVFKIYGITVENGGGGGFLFWFVKGQIGTVQQNATSIRPDHPMQFGQMSYDRMDVPAGTLNPFFPTTIVGQVSASGFDSQTTVSSFPLFILPAGWSLVGSNPGSALQAGLTCWYQVANE